MIYELVILDLNVSNFDLLHGYQINHKILNGILIFD